MIFDLRFAICDLTPMFSGTSFAPKSLSLTSRFSGVFKALRAANRLSGFKRDGQTAEAVEDPQHHPVTLLKQGVNEKCICEVPIMKRAFGLVALALLLPALAYAADYNLRELAKGNKIELFNRSLNESKTDSPETIFLSAASDDGLAWIKKDKLS